MQPFFLRSLLRGSSRCSYLDVFILLFNSCPPCYLSGGSWGTANDFSASMFQTRSLIAERRDLSDGTWISPPDSQAHISAPMIAASDVSVQFAAHYSRCGGTSRFSTVRLARGIRDLKSRLRFSAICVRNRGFETASGQPPSTNNQLLTNN
jgi:hypothetical protein